jgi:hypothetical protein
MFSPDILKKIPSTELIVASESGSAVAMRAVSSAYYNAMIAFYIFVDMHIVSSSFALRSICCNMSTAIINSIGDKGLP